MNRAEFISAIADETGMHKKDVKEVIEAGTSIIVDKVKNDEDVDLFGFGKFVAKIRKSREGKDPFGNPTFTPEHRVIVFKPYKATKEKIYDI